MHGVRVSPLKRIEIRSLAMTIRSETNLLNELRFPILEYVELALPLKDKYYEFRVGEMSEMGSNHGETRREGEHVIITIREDAYEGAYHDRGRDRGTVAHELGHYLMHARATVFARNFGDTAERYEDPEWQAKCFQGELLVPHHLVKGMPATQVAELCGVSVDAAAYQLRMYNNGR